MTNLADELILSLDAGQLGWPLALALIAGLLTALSPCVYPLVPITLSIMGARKYNSHLHGFLVASSYVLGMTIVYASLGAIFASLGILLGSLMQNPIMLIGLSLFFALMALAMFGIFPLTLPPAAMQLLSRVGGSGFKGAFLMGMVAGLVAAPCTGPVLGFILALIAEKQDLARGLWLMAAFSCGLGLPFLALGTFSSAVVHLPKSGGWMSGIKIVLGTAMLATALYYANEARPKTAPLPSNEELFWHTIDAKSTNVDVDALFEGAHALNQPILVDFYASWCIACRQMDVITYKDVRVKSLLKNFFLLKIDASTDSALIANIQKRFAITGLPTTLIFRVGEKNNPKRFFGFINADELLRAILIDHQFGVKNK